MTVVDLGCRVEADPYIVTILVGGYGGADQVI